MDKSTPGSLSPRPAAGPNASPLPLSENWGHRGSGLGHTRRRPVETAGLPALASVRPGGLRAQHCLLRPEAVLGLMGVKCALVCPAQKGFVPSLPRASSMRRPESHPLGAYKVEPLQRTAVSTTTDPQGSRGWSRGADRHPEKSESLSSQTSVGGERPPGPLATDPLRLQKPQRERRVCAPHHHLPCSHNRSSTLRGWGPWRKRRLSEQ